MKLVLWLALGWAAPMATAFAPLRPSSSRSLVHPMAASETTTVSVPLTWDEMKRQVATAVKQAASQGTTQQIVRVLLPRDRTSGDFGTYLEDSAQTSALVPPDESWQGGIMQLYRAALPTAEDILRLVTADAGLLPRVNEDRSVDESGVDGVGLLSTDDGAVSCWLQPTQECIDGIEESAKKAKEDQIVLLMNPQWRQVDDALDTYSKGEGFMANIASFLGGKGGSLKRLQEAGFQPVYSLEGYVCRGANVRLLQVLDSDWYVFCERDDGETFINCGSTPSRPSYQQVDELLSSAGVTFKFSRDMGMEPKL